MLKQMDKAVVIVAELSANHLQKYELAVRTVEAAKEAGADAVKLQTYTPDTITLDCDTEVFQIRHGTLWDGTTLHRLYREAYTPWEWQPRLQKVAEDLGLILFSAPFDRTAVDFLEQMNVPAYKIASFEITDIPLIRYVASKMKPVIISTGVATRSDIENAVQACREEGNHQIVLLKCTSAYPAPFGEVNLRAIPELARTFQTAVGISDHTPGFSVAVAAVALGARMIEKHFIVDRGLGGPDAAFSMEPEEFRRMSMAVREVEQALGSPSYELSPLIRKSRKFVRSLFVVEDVKQGEVFTEKNVRSIRPGDGLPPKELSRVLGKKAACHLSRGTPLSWDMIEE